MLLLEGLCALNRVDNLAVCARHNHRIQVYRGVVPSAHDSARSDCHLEVSVEVCHPLVVAIVRVSDCKQPTFTKRVILPFVSL
jgi:hypothetical protein